MSRKRGGVINSFNGKHIFCLFNGLIGGDFNEKN